MLLNRIGEETVDDRGLCLFINILVQMCSSCWCYGNDSRTAAAQVVQHLFPFFLLVKLSWLMHQTPTMICETVWE